MRRDYPAARFPLLLLTLAFLSLLFGNRAFAQGTWTLTSNMNAGRIEPSITLLSDGRVLVAGGGTPTGPSSSAELYNPGENTWTLTPNMAQARSGQLGVRLNDGRVLVAGGFGDASGHATAISEIYDPITDTWSATGSMNQPRAKFAGVLLPNGKVLAAAGTSSNPFQLFNSAELYDPTTGTWSFTGSLSVARCCASGVSLPDGTVLVAGGTVASCCDTNVAEIYNPSSGTWSSTGSMNQERTDEPGVHGFLLGNGEVLVEGGIFNQTCANALASAELFNPASGTWSFTGTMSTGRGSFTGAELQDGRVLVLGGVAPGCTTMLNTAEIYNRSTGTWTLTGNLNQARTAGAAVLLSDGRVLAASGQPDFSGSPPLNTAEIFSSFLVFSAFSAKVEISAGPAPSFEVKGAFTLGSGSDGINPPGELVKLQVASYSVTIPVGSFRQNKKGKYTFESTINGVSLEVNIRPTGGNSFSFAAEGQGVDLTGATNPVTVLLTIGDDGGSVAVNASFD